MSMDTKPCYWKINLRVRERGVFHAELSKAA